MPPPVINNMMKSLHWCELIERKSAENLKKLILVNFLYKQWRFDN
jgi:hypothetical protein